jgi:hypothetical protein
MADVDLIEQLDQLEGDLEECIETHLADCAELLEKAEDDFDKHCIEERIESARAIAYALGNGFLEEIIVAAAKLDSKIWKSGAIFHSISGQKMAEIRDAVCNEFKQIVEREMAKLPNENKQAA